jgi:hypothetical protein
MRVVIQRVTRADVKIEGQTVAAIGGGLLLFVGIGKGDGEKDAARLATKTRACGSTGGGYRLPWPSRPDRCFWSGHVRVIDQ